MRKIHLLGIALLAVFAFGAIAAASAFAAEPEWLVDEQPIAAGESFKAETEGDLILVKYNGGGEEILTEVLCEGILDGFLLPKGADEITEVLTLLHVAVGKESNGGTLEGEGLVCTVTKSGTALTDCLAGDVALVWPFGLPWLSQLELMEEAGKVTVLDRIFKDVTDTNTEPPGYDIECHTNSGLIGSELCLANMTAFVTNDLLSPMGVIGKPDESERSAECTLTGANSGGFKGTGTTHAIGAQLEWLDTLVDHEGFTG
jgi:hypothetical protein